MKHVTCKQIEAMAQIYQDEAYYTRLLNAYTLWHKVGMIQKHFTHDAILFIVHEGAEGFKYVKFFNDGADIRVSGHFETISEAYTDALVTYAA